MTLIRKNFTELFCEEFKRLKQTQGLKNSQISKESGVHPNTLGNLDRNMSVSTKTIDKLGKWKQENGY